MIVKNSRVGSQSLAECSFQVITQVLLALPKGRGRGTGQLKDMEFFTLSILQQHQPMIVGDIQRILGILPAQMSRIIRSLENRDRPLISCEINPNDKRKINVGLTAAGKKALADHMAPRVEAIEEIIGRLEDDDREDLRSLLTKLEEVMSHELVT